MASKDLKDALKDTWVVGAGYIPLGLAFGMFAVSMGIPWWWVPIISVFLYAGSMQFVAVELIVGGAGFASIALTTLFVNFRHVFYGISFPLRNMKSKLARLYGIHALTDETYALLATRDPQKLSGRRIFYTEVIDHLYWIAGTTAGALIVHWANFDATFMSFALTALFIVLAMDAYRANPRPLIVIGAAIAGGIGMLAGKDLMLIVSLILFTVIVLLRALKTGDAATGEDVRDERMDVGP